MCVNVMPFGIAQCMLPITIIMIVIQPLQLIQLIQWIDLTA